MLSGRYELGAPLGAGVSATVYRAFDTRTRSVVAVKVLNPHLCTDAVSLERFRREIRIARALGHPQIISIYDLVVEPDATYLVMECVEGASLKERLALEGPLPPESALGLLRQILDVLAACHDKGIVHRDLKPQNVMLRPDGLVKVLDFGIARMTMLADLTHTGTSLGSPEYMAPELFAASDWDPRSDLYALGVMLFELLTGELPFSADSLPLLYHRHLTAPIPSPAGVEPWLRHLVERLLAKAPHERYQSADEVLADLDARRVLARELPAPARRECLACSESTVAELPMCTRCGHDLGAALGRGMWDVVCTEATDRGALATWLRDALGERAPAVGRRTGLLLAGIDRAAAELFRQGALRRGVILSVARRSPFTLAKKLFSFIGLVGSLWVASGSLLQRSEDAYPFLPPHVAFLVTYARGIAAALAAWVCFQLFRRQAIRPAFGRATTARTYVATEFPWVRELVPNGRAVHGAMQTFLSALVEKRLLFARHVPTLDAGTREMLDRLLVSACRVAHAAADVERARAVVRRAAAEALGAEDAHASLLRKLVRLQAVFNRLLGRAIVLRLPLDAADTAALADCARDLDMELEATRQAGAELRRVA